MAKNSEWLNTDDLAAEFGIAKSTQAKYRSQKSIPYSKVGGFIYYSRELINNWLMQHLVTTGASSEQ